MARENPPTRLAADPSTSAVLCAMVTSARAGVPSRDTVLAFGVRLEAAIAANVAPPAVELPETLTQSLPADAASDAAQTQSATHPAQSGAFDTAARAPSSQTGPSSSAASTTPDGSQSLGTPGAPSPAPVSAATASAGWSVGAGLALMLGGLVAGGIWLASRGDVALTDGASATRNAPNASLQTAPSTSSADDDPANARDVDSSGASGTADGNARVPGDTSGSGDNSTLDDPSTTATSTTSAKKSSPGPAHQLPQEKAPTSIGLRSSAAEVGGDAPSAATRKPSAAEAAASEIGEEAALLSAARAALTRSPARALRITTQHAQRFPKGNLVQEREVIAIDALRRLGRTSEAQQRGAAFEQHYPGSVHRSKIEQTLEAK